MSLNNDISTSFVTEFSFINLNFMLLLCYIIALGSRAAGGCHSVAEFSGLTIQNQFKEAKITR